MHIHSWLCVCILCFKYDISVYVRIAVHVYVHVVVRTSSYFVSCTCLDIHLSYNKDVRMSQTGTHTTTALLIQNKLTEGQLQRKQNKHQMTREPQTGTHTRTALLITKTN